MKRVVWDERAVQELRIVATYIANDSPGSAERVVQYLRDRALLLGTSPELGRAVGDGTRELVLSRYPYVLEVAGDEVHIIALFHHRQNRR